jgi:hypothetical protein
MAPDFPSINRQAAGRPMAAAVAPERDQLPSSEAAAAALREGLETWVNELPAQSPSRDLARQRILTWQRENNGLPPEQTSQLDFYGLGLSSLPHVLSQLQNLTDLDLARNQLTQLPPCVCELAGLARLDLTLNPLPGLPSDIGRLTQLRFLIVRRCGLQELPEAIGNLASLQELNVVGNPALVRLPASFNRLQHLHTLSAALTGLEAQRLDVSGMPNLQTVRLNVPAAEAAPALQPRLVLPEAVVAPVGRDLAERAQLAERVRNMVELAEAQAEVEAAAAQARMQEQEDVYRAVGQAVGVAALAAAGPGWQEAVQQAAAQSFMRYLQSVLQPPPVLAHALRESMRRHASRANGAAELRAEEVVFNAQHNSAAELAGGVALPARGRGPARQLAGRNQLQPALPALNAANLQPDAAADIPRAAFSPVINDWHARLLAFAEGSQTAAVRLTLRLESSKLLRQMRTDTDFAALCGRLASYQAGSDTGALTALNDMHEAAMAARQEQPDTDERTLIALSADLFVLGLVKQAALAAAAPARAAGNLVAAGEIMLARQSALCAELKARGFRAPLPTRSVAFNCGHVLPAGQPVRELSVMQTLEEGTALRQHLVAMPVLSRHVETAFAAEFESMRADIQARMATLMRRSELQEGEIDPGPDDEPYANATDNAENRGPITEGTLMQEIPKLTSELEAKTTALRQRLISEVVERNIDVLQPGASAGATGPMALPDGSGMA